MQHEGHKQASLSGHLRHEGHALLAGHGPPVKHTLNTVDTPFGVQVTPRNLPHGNNSSPSNHPLHNVDFLGAK
jgi:hypothetical protein